MHDTIRQGIVGIIKERQRLIAIALRQRAKFEGWLKFELAAWATTNGAVDVSVEGPYMNEGVRMGGRSDITFYRAGTRYDLELKTPNSNWSLPGVRHLTRPITKNIAEIVADARKLSASADNGLVAFVLFPIPPEDQRWHVYVDRIAKELQIPLTPSGHCSQVTVPLPPADSADMVVCCFPVDRRRDKLEPAV